MTTEALNKANEISNKISDINESLAKLTNRVYVRKRDIENCSTNKKSMLIMPKWFAKGVIKEDDKVRLNIPIEGLPPLDFEIDEECVDFIIKHEKEKIAKLRKELEEL